MSSLLNNLLFFIKCKIAKGLFSYVISFIICCAYFLSIHKIIKSCWQYFLSLGDNGNWCYVYAINQLLFHSTITTLSALFWCFIYKSGYFEKYRCQKLPFPWEQDNKKWYKEILPNVIKAIFINSYIVNGIGVIIDAYIKADKYRKDYESFPELPEVIIQVLFCMVIEDFLFYTTHRIFHHKNLYKYHKKHHEHNVTYSISFMYTHPLDYIVTAIIPNVAGWKILGYRMHYATYCIWISWRILESMDGHSGYELPCSPYRLLPFSGSSDYHNFHHSNHQSGNYASFFTYWDSIFGTNKEYVKQNEKIFKTKYL